MFGFILLSYSTLYHLRDLSHGVERFALSECILLVTVLNRQNKGQSWGFTSRSTARVIMEQVLSIATCGTPTIQM